MPDFLIHLLNWISNPDVTSLTTVAGLAVVLKSIIIPFIKWVAARFKKDISGWKTIIAVYISAIVIAEIAGLSTLGVTLAVIITMLIVAVSAATGAIGLQQSVKLATKPTKI